MHNVSSKLTALEEKSWKWKCYQDNQIEKVANKIDDVIAKQETAFDTVHNVSSKLTALEEKMDAAIANQQSWKWKCYQDNQIEKVANKIDDVNAKLDKLIELVGPIGWGHAWKIWVRLVEPLV